MVKVKGQKPYRAVEVSQLVRAMGLDENSVFHATEPTKGFMGCLVERHLVEPEPCCQFVRKTEV
jgi:hypothetical protein